MTRREATDYMTARWHEQCERFPTMRRDIPLALYLRANWRATMRLTRRAP